MLERNKELENSLKEQQAIIDDQAQEIEVGQVHTYYKLCNKYIRITDRTKLPTPLQIVKFSFLNQHKLVLMHILFTPGYQLMKSIWQLLKNHFCRTNCKKLDKKLLVVQL